MIVTCSQAQWGRGMNWPDVALCYYPPVRMADIMALQRSFRMTIKHLDTDLVYHQPGSVEPAPPVLSEQGTIGFSWD